MRPDHGSASLTTGRRPGSFLRKAVSVRQLLQDSSAAKRKQNIVSAFLETVKTLGLVDNVLNLRWYI
ncbi:MAG: hypothetical protein A3H27_01385 [Acidobacteria bacterium RIFCSPLOWO2_02_FULL_59_13]|nr:MAG: hypothetical protein A3H27_01385 [Acidobacteria bacterium RIFCSPLOWO2_02_FULL_59_13]